MRSRVWAPVAAVVAVTVVGLAAPAQAAPAYPRADGRCVDRTGVLGAALCKKITTILLRDEKATSDEIAVAVVPTTGDESIEAWSTGLFNTWGVGKKDRNNGVLLVVAIDDHTVRLETGRGAADRLSDGEAQRIIDEVVTPPFAEDDYPRGVLSGLDEVRGALGHSIPANARLTSLAPATRPTAADESDGTTTTTGDESFFSGDDPGFTEESDDDSLPIGIFAVGALFVLVLLAIGIGRASASSPASAGPAGTASNRRRSHHDSVHHATWMAGSFGSTSSNSSSGFDSSSSSSSSFGGGSSDGSGASGSW
ncbi:TPM domain-containing protein [Actinoplanes sp. NPDC049681]|uniref:TPM domain-containing protein n=1 Tax=Actinoplanes sp. NPDC049681 TaxID=3363905 RepID=UPI0037AF6C51